MQVFSITVDDDSAKVIAQAFAQQFGYQPAPTFAGLAGATPSDATPSDATPSDATPNLSWLGGDASLDEETIAKMEFARQKVIDYVLGVISRYMTDTAVSQAQAQLQELMGTMTIT